MFPECELPTWAQFTSSVLMMSSACVVSLVKCTSYVNSIQFSSLCFDSSCLKMSCLPSPITQASHLIAVKHVQNIYTVSVNPGDRTWRVDMSSAINFEVRLQDKCWTLASEASELQNLCSSCIKNVLSKCQTIAEIVISDPKYKNIDRDCASH